MAVRLTNALRKEYTTLFARMKIRPERRAEIAAIGRRVRAPGALANYLAIETGAGVPWFVTAIIHNLESSLRFDRHLHNGDPLTARTRRVPKGRPIGTPPFSWQASALDALRLNKLHRWVDWSVPGIAFLLESYNGFGYRRNYPHVQSPYLWSFSNIYTRGKYVRDGVFSASSVSQQCGGRVLLRHLMDADVDVADRIRFGPMTAAPEDAARDVPNVDGPEGTEPVAEPRGTAPSYPSYYLRKGVENDPNVEHVQRRLAALGADPGEHDGDFGIITEYAVKLFQARSADPAGEPLEIDGVVGPLTWSALFGVEVEEQPALPPDGESGASTLAARVLEIAAAEVGVREVPLGSNRGPRVDEYIRSVGLDPTKGSYPWCMCFLYWCFREAASQLRTANRLPRTGGVHRAWNESRKTGAPVEIVTARQAQANPACVKPGMVFFLDTGRGRGDMRASSSPD
jgi:lysozyme family protein